MVTHLLALTVIKDDIENVTITEDLIEDVLATADLMRANRSC